MMKRSVPVVVFLAVVCMLVHAGKAHAQSTAKAELPVFITSSGQALDVFTVKTLLGRVGVEHGYDPLVGADKLAGVKTLVIVMGASVKGFGTAGITAQTELARTSALLKHANDNKLFRVGIHIGGSSRRDNLSQQFVEAVAPYVDHLMVWKDGNQDGYFTRVAEEKKIPLDVLNLPVESGKALAKLLGK